MEGLRFEAGLQSPKPSPEILVGANFPEAAVLVSNRQKLVLGEAGGQFGMTSHRVKPSVLQSTARQLPDLLRRETKEPSKDVPGVDSLSWTQILMSAAVKPTQPGNSVGTRRHLDIASPREVCGGAKEAHLPPPDRLTSSPKLRRVGQQLDRPSHRVTAILGAGGSEHRLQTLNLGRLQIGEILIGSRAKGRVVEAHSIDQVEDLIPGQPSQKGRDLSIGRLLQEDSGARFEGVANRRKRQAAQPVLFAGHHQGRRALRLDDRTALGRYRHFSPQWFETQLNLHQ